MDINQESILGSFLPNVYITKIILNDDRILLSLMIKENLKDDEELSYLNNDFLKEFINISVLQSTNKESTDQLADNFLELKDSFDLNLEKKLLNLQKTSNSKVSFDEEGNREIYYDCIFFLDTKQMQHLSYFVFCEINEQEIRKKFNLDSSVRLSYSPNKISNEIAIDGGEVTEESYIYLLPDGSLWPGAVKELSDSQYFTVEQEPRRLEKNVINNYKVQDFRSRTIKTLSPTSIEINNILATEGEDIISSFFNRKILNSYSRNKSFIYDIFHIKNSDNTVTINFKIDYSELLKQNSPFPALVNENSIFELLNDGIISNTEIINIKLFRRQVKSSINKLNNKPIDLKEPEIIIYSGIPEEINTVEANSSIKQYFITDLDISEKTSGEFQYYIEAEFKDGIIQFLRNKLESLIFYSPYLSSYYNSCILPENYDSDTDSFSKELILSYPLLEIANIVNLYINTIAQVYNLNLSEINKLQRILSLFTSPSLGNPEGVLYFNSLFNNLITKLSQYVSLNNNNSVSDSQSYSSPKETISIKKELNTIIDATLLNKVKIDYLSLNNGTINLESFRNRIKNEVSKYQLDNTNVYNNQFATCYLSPENISLENKIYNLFEQITDTEASNLRTQIQCLNEGKSFSKKILDDPQQDQKIRSFYNIRNILSEEGVTFEFLKISDSEVVLDDLEYNNIELSDVESLDKTIKINSKIYDASADIEQVYNKSNVPNILLTEQIPNQLIKFNDLPIEQKDLNKAKSFFDYGLLVRIEYDDKGTWKLLTDSELDKNISQPGIKSINCRLKKYEYNLNKINKKDLFKYEYTEYFILDLDSETTDNFITTAVPAPVPVIVEEIQTVSKTVRTKELQINQVFPEIKYYNKNNGTIGNGEIIIKGRDFKKGLKVIIFKDKVDNNNIVFITDTDKRNEIVSFNDKEIRLSLKQIKNYETIITTPLSSNARLGGATVTRTIRPNEISLIIKIINPNGESVEFNNFKLSYDNKIRFEQNRFLFTNTVTANFDDINKVAGIMDIGLGTNTATKLPTVEQETLNYIRNNVTLVNNLDLIRNNSNKLTSQQNNVKNLSSNSKNINLVKRQDNVPLNAELNSAKVIRNETTTTKQKTPEIKPERKQPEKQTIITNKINKNTRK